MPALPPYTSAMSALDAKLAEWANSYKLQTRDQRLLSVADLEELFFDTVADLQPDLFIEAGAKDAGTSRRMRSYLPDARIVAFEANPLTHRRFKRHKDNEPLRIEYRHRALSNTNGALTFRIRIENGKAASNGQGSLLAKETDTDADFKEVTVKANRLDKFFPPDTFKRCCLWVDVEGAHEMVLTGASGILSQVDVVFIEVEDRSVWQGQWLAPDVHRYLSAAGLVPLARDFQSRNQYNVLYLRPGLSASEAFRQRHNAWQNRITNRTKPSDLGIWLGRVRHYLLRKLGRHT